MSKLTNDEKPNAASYEVNGLMGETANAIRTEYNDILRALNYCSQAKVINEAEAIRDLLLAVITPALATIKKETTEAELTLNSNNLLGAKSSLFRLSKEENGDDIYLIVELASTILDVQGFPLKIKKGNNPIEIVNAALNLK